MSVLGDRVRLTQLFDNLLSNAIKFCEPADIITVRLKTDGNSAMAEICDTGRGFEEAASETIFQPFVQSKPRSDGARSGLGLGLAISRRLVELYGRHDYGA